MRTHGWGGDPPASDDEARRRLIEATMRCVGRFGQAKTSLADVAAEVGVTRKTIYRYFPSTEALLAEAGLATADDLMRRLTDAVADLHDPIEALVEVVAFAIEELPTDRYARMLLADGPTTFATEVLSSRARAAASGVLDRLGFDWDALLRGPVDREQLVELLLRLIHSFVLVPGTPPYSPHELRSFLRGWITSAVSAPGGRSG